MKKQQIFVAYVLIGIGVYYLLRQLKIPIFTDFYSWPTLLIILGIAFLVHGYSTRDYNNLFPGTILLGIGIHFHGVQHYPFWIDHWAVFPLIVGLAFFVRFFKTKEGLLPGAILVGLSLLIIFSIQLPAWFHWIYDLISYIELYWPIALIIVGLYLLKKK
ncbi:MULTISPECIES: DUF5668 domain-containing protein [unclassified Virgibacillus]|uniref:LiaI-LiaF-like domain-containing protein n=1 Tax=unclassified Virgibacillus TaxID=2620237 RepID=UPI0024DE3D14|nr:DUF5668 domain-containing protein [Virgibacillus sp. LDC-1]